MISVQNALVSLMLLGSAAVAEAHPSYVLYQHPVFDADDHMVERGKRDEITGWNIYAKSIVIHTRSGNDVPVYFLSGWLRDVFELRLNDGRMVSLEHCTRNEREVRRIPYEVVGWGSRKISCDKTILETRSFVCRSADYVRTISPYDIFIAQYDDTDLSKTPLIREFRQEDCEHPIMPMRD